MGLPNGKLSKIIQNNNRLNLVRSCRVIEGYLQQSSRKPLLDVRFTKVQLTAYSVVIT
jgi:hypothetical protein